MCHQTSQAAHFRGINHRSIMQNINKPIPYGSP